MWNDLHKKLSQKDMTRKEFLQFSGGVIALLFGLGNLITLVAHFTKTNDTPKIAAKNEASHGFGSRRFGE